MSPVFFSLLDRLLFFINIRSKSCYYEKRSQYFCLVAGPHEPDFGPYFTLQMPILLPDLLLLGKRCFVSDCIRFFFNPYKPKFSGERSLPAGTHRSPAAM